MKKYIRQIDSMKREGLLSRENIDWGICMVNLAQDKMTSIKLFSLQ
jgi:hypothetical protein